LGQVDSDDAAATVKSIDLGQNELAALNVIPDHKID